MERLNNIVTDFLTYSRPKPLDIQKADIHGLLNDTLDLLRHSGQSRGDITVKKMFDGELFVLVDPVKIMQVFWNLGINAFEAMEQGGELSVSTSDSPEKVTVRFSDTGPGITPEELSKVFYPFYTTKEKGTGLGLAIAYRIVEEHHGRLTVGSTPGIGTTFEIILPKVHGQ
jgi:signal transduction histidine kinase